jgi:hypothetical protein
VLEVVEEEQRRALAEVTTELALVREPQRLRDRRPDELRLRQRGERDPEDAAGESIDELRSRLERQARLSGAARSCDRDHSVAVRHQLADLCHLALTADQRRARHREIRPGGAEGLQRWKFRFHPRGDRLVEPLRRRQVLQPVLAQIEQLDLRSELAVHELRRSLRDQDLAAVAGAHHAGSPMHVQAGVQTFGLDRLAGVQTDADADRLRLPHVLP